MSKDRKTPTMTSLDFIMKVEESGFDHTNPDEVEALQGMIDTGLIWNLQGSWQRFGKSMIDAGIVALKRS